MNAYQVYNLGRPLEKGDIQELLRKTGSTPAIVLISRANEKFRSEIPDDLKVDICSGVSRCEIWTADQEVTPENRWSHEPLTISLNTPETLPGIEINVSKIDTEISNKKVRTRGRPRVSGSLMSRTTRWRREKEAIRKEKEMQLKF